MKLLILFGSYRRDSNGLRILPYLKQSAEKQGFEVEIANARELDLPMLDRMYREYEKGTAPANMEKLAQQIKSADAFIIVAGEYNHSIQPGLKNMIDHYQAEWGWRPVGMATYSAGRFSGMRVAVHLRAILGELGMVSIPTILGIGPVQSSLDEKGVPIGEGAAALNKSTDRFLNELKWYADALEAKRRTDATPYGLFAA
jgi:NAD(P)H-dependent FMN reductase